MWFHLLLFRFRSTYPSPVMPTSKKIWGLLLVCHLRICFVVFFVCSLTHFFDHVRKMRMLNANENTIVRFHRTIQSWLEKNETPINFFILKESPFLVVLSKMRSRTTSKVNRQKNKKDDMHIIYSSFQLA